MLKWGHTWGRANAAPASLFRRPPTTIREKPALFFYKTTYYEVPLPNKKISACSNTLVIFFMQKPLPLSFLLVYLASKDKSTFKINEAFALQRLIIQEAKATFAFKPRFLMFMTWRPVATTPTILTVCLASFCAFLAHCQVS